MDGNDPNSTNNNPANQPDGSADKGDGQGSKTFSQEEVNEIVRKRINEANAKSEEKLNKAVADAIAEQERKAKLTDEQRASEAQKAKETEIAKREQEVTLRERRAEASVILAEKNVPTELVEYIINEDADKMSENIDQLAKVWDEAVKHAVEEQLKLGGSNPKDRSSGSNSSKIATSSGVYTKNGTSAF